MFFRQRFGGDCGIWRDNSSLCGALVRLRCDDDVSKQPPNLSAHTDTPLMGLAGLGLRSAPFSVSHGRTQAEAAVAAWVRSHNGWNEQKGS